MYVLLVSHIRKRYISIVEYENCEIGIACCMSIGNRAGVRSMS